MKFQLTEKKSSLKEDPFVWLFPLLLIVFKIAQAANLSQSYDC